MDQVYFKTSLYDLSSVFEQSYRKAKQFTLIIENNQLFIILASYLTISQILILGVLSKDIRKLIQKCPNIQNRVLKAQISYLTQQQQKRLNNSKFANRYNNNSAYSLFQLYFDNFPSSLECKVPRIYSPNQINTSNIYLSLLWKKLRSNKDTKQPTKKLQSKQQNKYISAVTQQNQLKRYSQNTVSNSQLSQYIANDKQLQQIQKWTQLSKQREKQHEQFLKKVQKYHSMSLQQRKSYILNKFKANNVAYEEVYNPNNVAYVEVNKPDQSLIIKKQSIWDRIKGRFIRKSEF